MPDLPSAPLALIIDDDTMMRLLLHETLKKEGYEILEAENGKIGLDLCIRQCPDIVLLDVVMPEMDGFAVCQGIRAYFEGIKQIPILMMTGLDDIASINRAYELGATDFLTKPINWTILGYRLRYILRSSQNFEKLSRSQEALANAQELAKLGSWDFDIESAEFRGSEVMYRILGFTSAPHRLRLDDFMMQLHTDDRTSFQQAFESAQKGQLPINVEFRLAVADADERIIHGQSENMIKSGCLSGTFQDVTESRRAEEKISYLSFYDSLTGLANRSLFKEILAKSMLRAKRYDYKVIGLFLDLDKFQRINETLGPSLGDSLLKLVSERLLNVIRESDVIARFCTAEGVVQIARLGGDEFAILLEKIRLVEDAARVARRVLNALAAPFMIEGQEIFVTGSVGVTAFPDDGADVDAFMKNGDTAMHYAKEQGRNNYQFYNRSLNETALQRLSLENQLRHALENSELILYYQAQIETLSGRMQGVEALIRWNHPTIGIITPAAFIPLAEESGLIIPIGETVLREACKQIKTWQSSGLGGFTVAVNLAATHFQQPNFCRKLSEILSEEGVAAGLIEIELTESMLMHDVENNIRKMEQMKEIGVKLSIDDFGTGYSSLNYLMRFPIDTLKIDMSFIRSIPHDHAHVAITTAIIAMAKSLNMKVVAEGVENGLQARWLKENGCHLLQGYYFSRPVPACELPDVYNKLPLAF